MARVPLKQREDLSPEDQQIWDEVGNSRGGVAPNFQAIFNNPKAAGNLAHLGGYVRFGNSLDEKTKSLAALATAREANGEYVWTVQVPGAKRNGISDETIEAIHQRTAPAGLSDGDALIVRFVHELQRDHNLTDATYAAAESKLGSAGVVDLLILTGYYWGLAHTLNGLQVEPPGGSIL